MGLQPSFVILSRIVEQYESNGRTVRHVEATTSEDALHVAMDLPVSLCSGSNSGHSELTPEAATVTDRDELQVEFSSSILATLPPTTAAAVSASNQAVRVTDSGLLLTVELTIDPTESETRHEKTDSEPLDTEPSAAKADESFGSMDRSATPSHNDESRSHSELADLAAVRDESVPPYEDTEYLQRLYDSCDTFTEMGQTIEMDVTAETVRRYMIEASIHSPSSYNTAIEAEQTDEHRSAEETEDAETETETDPKTAKPTAEQSPSVTDPVEPSPDEQLVTDGIGLPEGFQIADIIDAVIDSATVYEVQQHLGLKRQRTQELLQQLNLLDLVMGRLADDSEREVSYEEIATRIRQCTPSGA